ncbi:MAG TPA: VOC family protein [Candidatus Manganitrophaceae bacterium]|nr:VOC family protein [Candidatus Manganitrophaceae bacterium]
MAGVRDIQKSVAFYAKLGLKPAMKMPYYVELNLPGGTVLGLHSVGPRKRGGTKKRMSDGGWGIMLRVENLEKVVADLKKKRVPCGKIETAPGGADFSSIHDPDGNRLTLVEMGR